MMPASTKAGGQCMAMPDVCKTPAPPAPPVPIPYPNIAMLPMAVGTVPTVLVMNMEAVVQTTKIPMSSGDEAGVAGGVVSGMIKGEVSFKLFSSKVKFGGKSAVFVTAMTGHNGTNANAVGAQIAPSQAKVIVAM